jgi:hypothetical protein
MRLSFAAAALSLCACACAARVVDGASLCQLNDCAAVYTSDGDLLKGTAVTYSPVCAADPSAEGCVGASSMACRICFFDRELWPERRAPQIDDCDVCVVDFFGVTTPAVLVKQSRMLAASMLEQEDLETFDTYAAGTESTAAPSAAPTASPTGAPVAIVVKRTEYCCPAGESLFFSLQIYSDYKLLSCVLKVQRMFVQPLSNVLESNCSAIRWVLCCLRESQQLPANCMNFLTGFAAC